MPNINEAFPSNYLKAADLQGREISVVISGCDYEKIGNDNKLVLYFQGKQKGVVLNKTNAMNISEVYGGQTEDWFGKTVTLFSVWTDYQGKSVQAIRIRAGGAAPQAPRQQQSAPPQQQHNDLSDEIPF